MPSISPISHFRLTQMDKLALEVGDPKPSSFNAEMLIIRSSALFSLDLGSGSGVEWVVGDTFLVSDHSFYSMFFARYVTLH